MLTGEHTLSGQVKLGLPDEVAGATAGFGREVTMESTDENTHEESMTWSINSNIKVSPLGNSCPRSECIVLVEESLFK